MRPTQTPSFPTPWRGRAAGTLLIGVALLASCASEPETTRDASTDGDAAPGRPRPAIAMSDVQTVEGLSFRVPTTWPSVEPSGAMRKAQFQIPGASSDGDGELVVFHFGVGSGGDTESNITRWIQQFDADEGATPGRSTIETAAGLKVSTVSLAGTMKPSPMMGQTEAKPGWYLLGSVIEGEGGPWFFKATGPRETLTASRDAYNAMIATFAPAQ